MGLFKSLEERIEKGCKEAGESVEKFHEVESELVDTLLSQKYRNQYEVYNMIGDRLQVDASFVRWVSHISPEFDVDQHGGFKLK